MSKNFWKAAGLRTLYSMIEAFIACVGTDASKIYSLNWKATTAIVLFTGLCTLARCIKAGLPEVRLTETLSALDNDPDDDEDELEEGEA